MIISALVDYNCILKVKSAMDQFCEGLQEIQVFDMLKKYPVLMKPFFMDCGSAITAG